MVWDGMGEMAVWAETVVSAEMVAVVASAYPREGALGCREFCP